MKTSTILNGFRKVNLIGRSSGAGDAVDESESENESESEDELPPLSAEDEEAISSLFDTDTEDESFHGFGEEEDEKNAGSDLTDSLSIYRTHRLRTFREWTLTLTRLPVACTYISFQIWKWPGTGKSNKTVTDLVLKWPGTGKSK